MRADPALALSLFVLACAHPEAAPAPAAAPPAPAPAASPAAPPADPATATELLARRHADFDACYARARSARPELRHAVVEVSFTVDDTGKPSTVSLEYKHRWDDAAKDCMRAAALALEFPPALRGKQVGTITFESAQ
jgi:hypothetical protein